MKEPVRRAKNPKLVAVFVVAIAAVYFVLLAKGRYPEPGSNVVYDVEPYELVDRIETRFEEAQPIPLDFESAQAIATTPDGKLYVAGKNTVVAFGEDGAEISRFEVDGTPQSMTIAPDGTIFLGIKSHITLLNIDGKLQAVWPDLGPRAYVTSIAVNDEEVFVADAGNRVVLRFDRQGVLQGRIGEIDLDRDIPGIEVPSPYLDVAFDSDGTLWVVNPGRLGLESYRSNGDLITSWYKPTLDLEGFSGCCNPCQIAFDRDGRLIAGDKGLVRIKAYEVTSGEFTELIAGSKLFAKGQPIKDIAVDARNRILVLDPKKNAVRIFEQKEGDDGQISESA